ncbi:hypothetical protein JOB18_004623 [Solea senegalensis]|uniref:Uncharacterized protein n=1 Tax=Solea senegalensis TaxID=28829 RepID=A0AAV6SQG7_SOLSE|nr:hypothetical protein JOB18_004623 [Solea senegalensis]
MLVLKCWLETKSGSTYFHVAGMYARTRLKLLQHDGLCLEFPAFGPGQKNLLIHTVYMFSNGGNVVSEHADVSELAQYSSIPPSPRPLSQPLDVLSESTWIFCNVTLAILCSKYVE